MAGDHRIVCRMRLVETIVRKVLDRSIDLVGLVARDVVRFAAFPELDPVLGDEFVVFLGDGAADHIGLAARIAGQVSHNADNLFLVDNHPVGLVEDRFQGRVNVLDLFLAMFPPAVRVDELHRPGAIEGDNGDDVFQGGGAHLSQCLFHPAALDLEHAHDLSVGQQIKDTRIVCGDIVEGVLNAVPGLDQFRRLAHLGQCGQAQKVELEQSDALHDGHRELGDSHI